jgi:superfamily II DNA or RNA helicase
MFATKELKLYPIQETIVDACRETMRHYKKIILQAATGLGKTIISTWIIKQAARKGLRILFVCDRISLINQTSEVFHDYGLLHGIYQADNPLYAPELPIQIGSIQTLARRKQRDYDLIIFDEIHSFFKAHERILEHNPDAFFLGLSATPFTKGLGKYFDTHIEPVPMRQLIDEGYLCDFEVYGPATIDLSKVRTVAGDYREDDLSTAADKPELVADVVQTWLKLANGLKTIVFAVNVAHARHLEKIFRRNGVSAREINGYMPKEGDDGANQIIQDFRNSDFKVLISVEMIVKGFDVPDVECIIFATATKSIIKWIQACGRGLRTFQGKILCRILDHGSNCERLGFPDEYEFLELDDGKHQRTKNKLKEHPEKLPKKCPSCDFLKPAGVRKCPACQFEPKFIQDVDVEEGELKKLQRKNKKEYSLQDKQSFLAQLNQYAHDKGFREGKNGCYGWALHKYKDKFGTDVPSRLDWGKREPVKADVKGFITHINIAYAKSKEKTMVDGCKKCGSKKFKITQAGPHRKLSCAKCGAYIKFVPAFEETELTQKGMIT